MRARQIAKRDHINIQLNDAFSCAPPECPVGGGIPIGRKPTLKRHSPRLLSASGSRVSPENGVFQQNSRPQRPFAIIALPGSTQCPLPLWPKAHSDPLLPVKFLHSGHSRLHSITLSARSMTTSGILMPSAFAVLRLMVVSNLIGCSMGRSRGLAPLNILSA